MLKAPQHSGGTWSVPERSDGFTEEPDFRPVLEQSWGGSSWAKLRSNELRLRNPTEFKPQLCHLPAVDLKSVP